MKDYKKCEFNKINVHIKFNDKNEIDELDWLFKIDLLSINSYSNILCGYSEKRMME